MPRIQCRKCGKVSEVAPQDAGGVIVCGACGGRNEGRLAAQDGAAWAAMRMGVEKDVRKWKQGGKEDPTEELEAHVGALASEVPVMPEVAAEVVNYSAPKVAPSPIRFGSPLAWAAGVVLLTLAIVLSLAIAKLNEPKKVDYSDLMEMQRKAESLAAAGDLPAAEETYGGLFDKANERGVDDPLVLERLAKAKRDGQRGVKIRNERERQEMDEFRGLGVVVL